MQERQTIIENESDDEFGKRDHDGYGRTVGDDGMNWSMNRLGDLCEVITKGTTPTSVGFNFTDKGIGFLRVQNIENGGISNKKEILFIDEQTNQALSRSKIQPGDVLLSIAGTIGRIGIVPENAPPLNCNQAIAIIRTTKIFKPFLRYWLESIDAQYQMIGVAVTGTITNLSLTQVGNLQIPLPAFSEQKRIAAILDKADAIRRKRQAAIKLADDFLRATFLDMFGDPVTNPKGITVVSLESLCTRVTDGTHQPPKWSQDGIPFIFISNVNNNNISFDTQKHINLETWQELTRRCPIEKNDILYTTVGSYGNVALVNTDQKFAFQRHIAHIKPDPKKIKPKFLVGMLQSSGVKKQADTMVRGIAQKTLNLTDLKKFVVFKPEEQLQKKFISIRAKLLNQIQRFYFAQSYSNNIFNSLSQRAFRGDL